MYEVLVFVSNSAAIWASFFTVKPAIAYITLDAFWLAIGICSTTPMTIALVFAGVFAITTGITSFTFAMCT